MEEATLIESLFEKAEEYAKTNVDLFKLKAIDKSADVVSSLASKFIILIVVSLITIMVNIGLALWIGELMGKTYYGFFIVAAFYVLVACMLYIMREQFIKTPVSNSIITQMLKDKTE